MFPDKGYRNKKQPLKDVLENNEFNVKSTGYIGGPVLVIVSNLLRLVSRGNF